MFHYSMFATLILFASVLYGLPLKLSHEEPERCCVPKLFSSQISTSSSMKLSDGTIFNTYVNLCFEKLAFFNVSFIKSTGLL